MAYNTKKLFDKALILIKEKNLYFAEDVIALLGVSAPTFYAHFKVDSNELNTIKELLISNRVSTKVKMRKQWSESDNATLQVALMKIISNEDEAHRLNGTVQKIEHSTPGGIQINIKDFTKKDE